MNKDTTNSAGSAKNPRTAPHSSAASSAVSKTRVNVPTSGAGSRDRRQAPGAMPGKKSSERPPRMQTPTGRSANRNTNPGKSSRGRPSAEKRAPGNSAARNRSAGKAAPSRKKPPSSGNRSYRPPKALKPQKVRTLRPPRQGGMISQLVYAIFRYFQKKFGGFLSFCICIFAAYFLVSALFCSVYAGFFFGNTKRHDAVTYLYTDGTETEKNPAKEQQLSFDSVFRGTSEPYINMTELSQTLGLIIVGNNHQLRFSLPDAPESSVLFTGDSRNVVVNGCNSVVLSSPARIVGRAVYVPLSFLQNYTTGFAAAYDAEENRMTIDRLVDESASTETTLVYIPFTYTIGDLDALETISEEEAFS